MMMNSTKDDLRAMRMRATDLYKQYLRPCVGVTLIYSVVSVGLSYLLVYISNTYLAAFALLVQAFIAASLMLGMCDYFLARTNGQKASPKALLRYFDTDSLPMVALLAGVNWVAGMVGTLMGGLSLALQLIVQALMFLVPYLYIVRGGTLSPIACVREAVKRMENRWSMYVRILARQYIYTVAASIVLSVALMLVSILLASVGLTFLVESNVALIVTTLILSVIISAFVMAFFQLYQAEFAISTICRPKTDEGQPL